MLWKPDKSARGPITHVEEPIRDRLTTTLFTYCILLHSWLHTPMAASSIMSLLKRVQTQVMKKNLQLFLEQAMGSYLKKKYIKTAQINLREWQKWQQLLILYTNIVTLWCYPRENRMYSINSQASNSAENGYNCIHTYARMHADILGNSNNLLYHYKFGISIYQKYQCDISQLSIPRCCLQY